MDPGAVEHGVGRPRRRGRKGRCRHGIDGDLRVARDRQGLAGETVPGRTAGSGHVVGALDASDVQARVRNPADDLRRRLGQEMRIRSVPELHFHHDASVETGRRMDELIETAVSSDRHADEDEEPSA